MSKTYKKVIDAFLSGKKCKVTNTMTNGHELFLFDNCIARRDKDIIQVTTSNWNTVTTRDRLNMILGIYVRCQKNNLQINLQSKWQDWDGKWITI